MTEEQVRDTIYENKTYLVNRLKGRRKCNEEAVEQSLHMYDVHVYDVLLSGCMLEYSLVSYAL